MAGQCHINLQHNITLSLHDIHRLWIMEWGACQTLYKPTPPPPSPAPFTNTSRTRKWYQRKWCSFGRRDGLRNYNAPCYRALVRTENVKRRRECLRHVMTNYVTRQLPEAAVRESTDRTNRAESRRGALRANGLGRRLSYDRFRIKGTTSTSEMLIGNTIPTA